MDVDVDVDVVDDSNSFAMTRSTHDITRHARTHGYVDEYDITTPSFARSVLRPRASFVAFLSMRRRRSPRHTRARMLSASTSPACARTITTRARATTRSRVVTPSTRRGASRRVVAANTSQDVATSSATSRRGLLLGTIGIAALTLSGPPAARAADAPRVVGAAVSAPNKFWLANGCYWGRQVRARASVPAKAKASDLYLVTLS